MDLTDRFVLLLRHGEAAGGACFRGTSDDPLSAQGWEQLRTAAAREPRLERIISSPARRCAAFACALACERGLAAEPSPAFAERGFGAWEGLPATAIPAPELAAFWADPAGYTPPGAEPFPDFQRRVLAGWEHLAAAPAPAHTLVLTHGGVVRVILARVLGMDDPTGLRLEVPPACRTRLRLPPPPGLPSLMAHVS